LEECNVRGLDLEMVSLETEEDMRILKNAFRLRFPCFMANVVKILLYRGEEKLACLLTAYYEISIDEEMIISAIDHGHFDWLNFVFAFGKNYTGVRRFPKGPVLDGA
jgi:hypothetical protein